MATDDSNARSSGSERAPAQAEVIRRALRAFGSDLRVCLPGVVTKWDASKQQANIKIPIKQAFLDEEDNRQVESWPDLPGIPVEFPGAGDVRITFPISDGNLVDDDGNRQPATMGLLHFSDFSLDKWLTGNGEEVDPEIDHQHALTDAIFVPGLRTFGSPWSSCPAGHGTMGYDSGVQIHFHKQVIALGDENGNDWGTLASKVNGNFDTLYNLINSLFGASSTVLNTTAPAAPDAVYVAIKAALVSLVAAGKWPLADTKTSQIKLK